MLLIMISSKTIRTTRFWARRESSPVISAQRAKQSESGISFRAPNSSNVDVLFVKLSSMGDLIHALPALTDAQRAIPGIRFDWVIDEAFADVGRWHPAVEDIIPSAHRRWMRKKWSLLRSGEWLAFVRRLRSKQYDLVIDGQTNLRSACVTRLARGLRCGLDRRSVRECGADWAYQKRVFVSKTEHAIDRLRKLFAAALNYAYRDTEADFAIDRRCLTKPDLALPDTYLVFIHNASWRSKLWPEPYWGELLGRATARGYSVLLPTGDLEEHARATRLAQAHPGIIALPRLRLSEVAYIIARARAAVCNDTGLGNLAAALKIPSVHLYGPTDPQLIGASGNAQIRLQADFPCAPCRKSICRYTAAAPQRPACFTTIPPQAVWEKLQSLL
jgi:heptosyltransferase-1